MHHRTDADQPSGHSAASATGGLARVVRWAWYSIGLNLILMAVHGFIAARSGSLAVTAELLHNFVDLASAAAVVAGLRLAMRKSRAFPYGLYKIENLVAAGVAVMIFFTAYEVAGSVFRGSPTLPHVDAWMLASLIVAAARALMFSHFEIRVARQANSPALMANAREYRVHAYTTGLAFAALLSAWFDLPLDRIAALIIVIAVAKTGWDLLADALRVLLDASLDAKSLAEIKTIIEADPALAQIKWITGRNAGRYRFVEAGVVLRPSGPAQTGTIVNRIETSVRTALPQIERILLHAEPHIATHERYAVPVADLSGTISAHFGEAPYFAFITILRASGMLEEQHIRANPFRNEERAKGIRVAEWLVGEKVDRVLLPKRLEGKGPSYVFREAGIETEEIDADRLDKLFADRRPAD